MDDRLAKSLLHVLATRTDDALLIEQNPPARAGNADISKGSPEIVKPANNEDSPIHARNQRLAATGSVAASLTGNDNRLQEAVARFRVRQGRDTAFPKAMKHIMRISGRNIAARDTLRDIRVQAKISGLIEELSIKYVKLPTYGFTITRRPPRQRPACPFIFVINGLTTHIIRIIFLS